MLRIALPSKGLILVFWRLCQSKVFILSPAKVGAARTLPNTGRFLLSTR